MSEQTQWRKDDGDEVYAWALEVVDELQLASPHSSQ
jgi:hypothetical protein